MNYDKQLIDKYQNLVKNLKKEIVRLNFVKNYYKEKSFEYRENYVYYRKMNDNLTHELKLKVDELSYKTDRIKSYEDTLEKNAAEKGDYMWLEQYAREKSMREENDKKLKKQRISAPPC
jgi:hypothetical protein